MPSPGVMWGPECGLLVVERVVDRVPCALGACCAGWAFRCAIGAGSASRAVGRGNGKEKVYGSIPQGGSQVIDIFSKLLPVQFVVAARRYGRFGYPCRGVPSFSCREQSRPSGTVLLSRSIMRGRQPDGPSVEFSLEVGETSCLVRTPPLLLTQEGGRSVQCGPD